MIPKNILVKLYSSQRLSIDKTAGYLGVSKSTVSYWIDKHNISVRSKVDAAYAQHNKAFKIKENLSSDQSKLLGLGIGLYWGEGNKVDPFSVRLGNTDPSLVVMFVKFLKDICGVNSSDIRYGLQVFNDADPVRAKEFWISKLECTEESFQPTVSVVPSQGNGTYKRKNIYGVLQVCVSNKKLKKWIMQQIDQYAVVAQG